LTVIVSLTVYDNLYSPQMVAEQKKIATTS